MHSGGHSWYNNALIDLLEDIDDPVLHPDGSGRLLTNTEKLSALDNFLRQASDPANILPDSKTGGYLINLSPISSDRLYQKIGGDYGSQVTDGDFSFRFETELEFKDTDSGGEIGLL